MTLAGLPVDLTPREFDLLSYLASRAGSVVSRRELLTQVWRQPYGGADDTVDVHLSWLRRKLGESAQQPRYLHTIRGVGVKLVRPRRRCRRRRRMRARLILLVGATSSLVLVAFLVPLALLVRSAAADRALSAAVAEAQALAPAVGHRGRSGAATAVGDQANAAGGHQITVFLPDGTRAGCAGAAHRRRSRRPRPGRA